MIARTILKDIFKKQKKFIQIPFLKRGMSWILSRVYPELRLVSTKPIDELSERCVVDFLIRQYKQKKGSEFSVIDIGAGPPPNYYEMCLKYTNHIYCVEPALDMQDNPYSTYIKKLIDYSERGRLNLFKGVISDKNGEVTFYKGKGSTAISSLDPYYRIKSISDPESSVNSFEKIMVESKTYQQFFADNDIKNLLFVKIDVEGAEGRILTTMNKSNAPKILLLEAQYNINELKKQIRRLVCEENVFHESLFIIRNKQDSNFDILGEFRFNEHLDFLKDECGLYKGSLILALADIIQKEEIRNLRREIYSNIRVLDNI